MLRTIHLHGALKRRFKMSSIRLDADSVAEAVRGLCVQLPGFSEYIRERQYLVTAANDDDDMVIEPEALLLNLGRRRHIHLIPSAQAAGLETILIVGLVLVAAVSVASVFLMRPKVPDASSREKKDQSFIFGGAINSQEQGHSIPVIYGGPIRVGSLVASAGISTTDIAIGSISASGGYVGSTQGVLGGSGGGGGRIWGIDSPIRALKGGKSGGGSSRAAEESPNTLRSQATVRIVDLVGEGEIGGLVNGLKSVYLDNTPVQNPDGSFNFSGYSLEERLGLPDQDPMPGFTEQQNGVDVSQDVHYTTPVVKTISDPVVDVARVTLSVNSLFQQDTKNGDLLPTSVQIAIDHQSDGGGYTQVVLDTIQGKTNSPYQRSYDIRLDGPAPHNIRVRRVTPDSDVTTLQNATRWESYFEIVEAKLSYPDSALYGVTADAKQFGTNIPNRSYELYGLVIDIPTNYDPVTRVYTGIWDGTFKRAVCNNPAWVLYDIIRNKRYGLGARIPIESVDKFGLYAVAQYCDGLIPDGKGGTQPRYTINACINSPESAYNVLASIASAFRGFIYWGSGSMLVTQDRPEDPSILVTRSNVVDGKISYQSTIEKQKLRSVAIVYWNDPEDDYNLVPEIVEDNELIRRMGWEPGDSVVRFGCTNRAEAHYAGRWILDDQKYANKAVRYEAADDHSFVNPGSIAAVADQKFTSGRQGGRVAAGSTTTVVQLDKPVTLVGGRTYGLRVFLPDGSTDLRTVSSGAGEHGSLTLTAALPIAPAAGAVWALESDVVANRQFRIRSATADEPPYAMYGVLHDPLSYDRVEQEVDLTPPNFIDLPTGPLATPDELTVVEFLLNDGTAASPAVQFSWQSSPDPRILFYQARFKRPTGDWETLDDSSALARVIRNSEPGTWSFMVRAVDGLGRKTAWAAGEILLDGQVDAMPEVVGAYLFTNPSASTAKLMWTAPNDHRPLRYDVMLNRAATVLAGATYLGTTDTLEWTVSEPGHYWIRTRFINVLSPAPPRVDVGVTDIDFLGDLGDLSGLDVVLLGSGGQVRRQDGVTPVTDSTAITALGTAASITGQAATATSSDFNVVTGATKPANNATVGGVFGVNLLQTIGGVIATLAAFRTADGTAAAIAGQGALATLAAIAFGDTTLKESSGGATATLANFKTALGQAASILSQGSLATQNTAAWLTQITGSGKPEDDATVGAAAGVNLKDSAGGAVLALAAIKTILGTAAGFTGQGALATKNLAGAADISVPSLSAIVANLGIITAGLLQSPTGSTQLDLNNNRLIFNTGAVMFVLGLGFGSTNQFLIWVGPSQANLNTCTEANGTFWVKTNAQAYFGGSLSAGTLKNGYQTTDISATAQVETASFGSNGGSITVTLSYNYTAHNDYQTFGGGVGTEFDNTYGSGPATIDLYRSIGGAAYVKVATLSAGGTYRVHGVTPTAADSAPGHTYEDNNLGGSITYTDPSLSTANRQYKAVMTGRTVSVTNNPSQSVSIIAVEQ